jgi:hypothetical protein
MKKQSTPTSSFLNLLNQCDKQGDFSKVPLNKLKQLDSCTENVVIETMNSIGAIGDLLFWSFNLDEPPVENVGQIGLLLRSLSDLLTNP